MTVAGRSVTGAEYYIGSSSRCSSVLPMSHKTEPNAAAPALCKKNHHKHTMFIQNLLYLRGVDERKFGCRSALK